MHNDQNFDTIINSNCIDLRIALYLYWTTNHINMYFFVTKFLLGWQAIVILHFVK